ncbi:antigenic protein [Trypanosoma brucei equiperdum]|uniref:Antigenic protein n=1 Tax=Trypanosoma brucei equiperdum TaxID=630700 RepID=A0A3L6L9M3_9TRYP|nr:antigenic protein [Trypanosoma brucei equiperdum]
MEILEFDESVLSQVKSDVVSVGDLVAFDTLRDDSWCYEKGYVTFLSDYVARVSVANNGPSQDVDERATAYKEQLLALRQQLRNGRAAVEEERIASLRIQVERANTMVEGIEGACFRELQSYVSPPPIVRKILDDILIILGITLPTSTWAELRAQLRQPGFIARVLSFDPSKLPPERRNEIIKRCRSNDISDDDASVASRAAGPLHQWVKAQLNYVNHNHVAATTLAASSQEHLERIVLAIRDIQDRLAAVEGGNALDDLPMPEKTILRSSIIPTALIEGSIPKIATIHRPELWRYITLQSDSLKYVNSKNKVGLSSSNPDVVGACSDASLERGQHSVDEDERIKVMEKDAAALRTEMENIRSENRTLLQQLAICERENKVLRGQLEEAQKAEEESARRQGELIHSLEELQRTNDMLEGIIKKLQNAIDEGGLLVATQGEDVSTQHNQLPCSEGSFKHTIELQRFLEERNSMAEGLDDRHGMVPDQERKSTNAAIHTGRHGPLIVTADEEKDDKGMCAFSQSDAARSAHSRVTNTKDTHTAAANTVVDATGDHDTGKQSRLSETSTKATAAKKKGKGTAIISSEAQEHTDSPRSQSDTHLPKENEDKTYTNEGGEILKRLPSAANISSDSVTSDREEGARTTKKLTARTAVDHKKSKKE